MYIFIVRLKLRNSNTFRNDQLLVLPSIICFIVVVVIANLSIGNTNVFGSNVSVQAENQTFSLTNISSYPYGRT